MQWGSVACVSWEVAFELNRKFNLLNKSYHFSPIIFPFYFCVCCGLLFPYLHFCSHHRWWCCSLPLHAYIRNLFHVSLSYMFFMVVLFLHVSIHNVACGGSFIYFVFLSMTFVLMLLYPPFCLYMYIACGCSSFLHIYVCNIVHGYFFFHVFVHNDACDCFLLLHSYGHNVGCVTITFKYHHYHHLCFYSWYCFPFLYVASTSP